MSIKLMSRVWDHATDLEGSALIVMLALADWADDTGACWPGMPAIGKKARISERQARNIVRALADAGYVRIEEQRGRNHTNRYFINLQKLFPVLEAENLQPASGLSNAKPEIQRTKTGNSYCTQTVNRIRY